MIQIEEIHLPNGIATYLILKCLTLDMTATTAQFYYGLCSDETTNNAANILLDGNLEMSESEYLQWGADNNYCIQWAANKLNLKIK